jgi:L-lactate dehydrogenase complex protein LldG
MSDAREEILARIRAATGRAATGGAAPGRMATQADVDAAYAALPRGYLRAHHDPAATDIVALFAERAADYRAVVERVPETSLADAIARAVAALPRAVADPPGAALPRLVVPDGLPTEWIAALPAADAIVRDDPPLSARDLDAISGVITGCAAAIAETGTIILDHGPGQGRRALTLVPDFHLVVLKADQVEADIAGALARLDPARPHTLISGPSATSDIELIRVEGVHGPRNLHILVADAPRSDRRNILRPPEDVE